MTPLDKLIQQYERENPGETAYVNPPMNLDFSSKFTRWLASRPTCGKEQRKFLDEVEKLEYQQGLGYKYENEYVFLSKNFKQINLQKVIQGE
ncbi:hypothetical protein [Leptospira phage LE3]|uniref:Uncharacterized protein n=1 Tax=Leptospira phage LE3 TaxID=2041382 RepID=A0A343LE77_9CAUD|nr:hypothetical protein HWB33_gp07 [Leptospira phage LE3]ATN94987.1 hypothetical protein [Leptospira phage LE3]